MEAPGAAPVGNIGMQRREAIQWSGGRPKSIRGPGVSRTSPREQTLAISMTCGWSWLRSQRRLLRNLVNNTIRSINFYVSLQRNFAKPDAGVFDYASLYQTDAQTHCMLADEGCAYCLQKTDY